MSTLRVLLCLLFVWTANPAAAAESVSSIAESPPHHSEIYVPAGVVFFSSTNRLIAGVGGGLGYRYDLDSIWTVYTEGRTSFYTGSIGTLALGITGQFSVRSWHPQLGIGAIVFVGDSIRVSSSTQSAILVPAAFAITTRISPLRFVRGRFAASALSVDVGCGIDSGSRCAIALSVAVLEAGLRF